MTKASERETVKAEHVNGGAGFIMKESSKYSFPSRI